MNMLTYEQPIPSSAKRRGSAISEGSTYTPASVVLVSESQPDWRLLEVSKI